MFKDASEELARLEAELLAEEEPEEEYDMYDDRYDDQYDDACEEEYEEPEDPWLYEDTAPAGGSVVYQNYSNDYGKNLRNYASGYRAYNSDTSDRDLEAYSQEVYQGKKSRGGTVVVILLLILLLAAGVLAYIAWQKGYLG